jgi:hypothetical protein
MIACANRGLLTSVIWKAFSAGAVIVGSAVVLFDDGNLGITST